MAASSSSALAASAWSTLVRRPRRLVRPSWVRVSSIGSAGSAGCSGSVLRLRGRFTRARFRLGRFGLGTATTTPGLDRGGQLIQGGQLVEAERHLRRNRFVGATPARSRRGLRRGTGGSPTPRGRRLGLGLELVNGTSSACATRSSGAGICSRSASAARSARGSSTASASSAGDSSLGLSAGVAVHGRFVGGRRRPSAASASPRLRHVPCRAVGSDRGLARRRTSACSDVSSPLAAPDSGVAITGWAATTGAGGPAGRLAERRRRGGAGGSEESGAAGVGISSSSIVLSLRGRGTPPVWPPKWQSLRTGPGTAPPPRSFAVAVEWPEISSCHLESRIG